MTVSIVLMTMNVDTLVCVIQMPTVPIPMAYMNVVLMDSLVMVINAVILRNVLQFHVTRMPYVQMFQAVSCANVIKGSLVMVLHVQISTNAQIHHAPLLDNVPMFLVILLVLVTKDILVMDKHVLLEISAANVTHVTIMQHVTDKVAKLLVNAIKVMKEMENSVMTSTNVEPEKLDVRRSQLAQMFPAPTDVNDNLVSSVTVITVSMSTNV